MSVVIEELARPNIAGSEFGGSYPKTSLDANFGAPLQMPLAPVEARALSVFLLEHGLQMIVHEQKPAEF